MSSNIENSKDWLIHIGERVSLSFKDSSLSQDSSPGSFIMPGPLKLSYPISYS